MQQIPHCLLPRRLDWSQLPRFPDTVPDGTRTRSSANFSLESKSSCFPAAATSAVTAAVPARHSSGSTASSTTNNNGRLAAVNCGFVYLLFSFVEPAQALETILNLDFTPRRNPNNDNSNSNNSNTLNHNTDSDKVSLNLQWLRSLYLARVHVAAPTGGMVKEGSRAADALAASMSMDVVNNR